MAQVLKEVTLQPNIFLDCFRFDKENDICRKKNHQGSRFLSIESAKVFSTEGYETTKMI